MQVDVCIITFRRPRMLEACLRGLAGQTLASADTDVEILIVDNDPDGSARDRCDTWAEQLSFSIRYVQETQRGIPYSRNRAIASIREQAEFVVFIDDDEVPEPGWLQALLDMQAEKDADVVSGPVLSCFEEGAPDWATTGTLYRHLRYADGEQIEVAATGNVLIRRGVFDNMNGPFDVRLALTGGSDWHFFLRVQQAGHRMFWADRAIVSETVPASRLSVGWMLKRFYRNGITHGFCAVDLSRSPVRHLSVALRGAAWIGAGVLLLPIGLLRSRWRAIKYLRCITFGAGQIASLFGRRYEEYREIHGS